MKKAAQITLAITFVLAAIAAAQESKIYREGDAWVEETRGTLTGQRNLKLITNLGSVHVQGVTGNTITYVVKKRVHGSSEQEARRAFEQLHIAAGNQGDTAWLKGQGTGNYSRGRSYSADFDVQAPRGISVSARTGGGNLAVNDIDGQVEANTGGGNVSLDDIGGAIIASSGGGTVDVGSARSDVKVETGGGNISLGSINGPVYARSGGGSIHVNSGRQNVTLETGGGHIMVASCGGDLTVETGGGNIIAERVGGKASLKTGGGAIKLSSAKGAVEAESGGGSVELYHLMGGARAETGSGRITAEFVGQGSDFTDSRLETAAGDIRVYLPGNLPVTIQAAVDMTSGQRIHSDFPGLQVSYEGSVWGPKQSYCQGTLNGGGKVLHIHTSTGNIELLKHTASLNDHNPR